MILVAPMKRLWSFSCALLLFLSATQTATTSAFYVPGVQPHGFERGEVVPLKVNALTSTHTQIPRDYYRLPFCKPQEGVHMMSENLGEFLTGNKIQNSPYTIRMLEPMNCNILCQTEKPLDKLDASKMRLHIKYEYHNNWIIDNMPSAAIGLDAQGNHKKRYAGGFPIGFIDAESKEPFVYNHVNIHLDYFTVVPSTTSMIPSSTGTGATANADPATYRVVGFAVEPLSVKHKFADKNKKAFDPVNDSPTILLSTCPEGKQVLEQGDIRDSQSAALGQSILFTYGVVWHSSEMEWSSRWDLYLSEDHLVPAQVHWYSITNSILVVVFLSLLVVSILVRNLRRDIAAYNSIAAMAVAAIDDTEDGNPTDPDDVDETGWKLVHADVFRPPSNYPMLYCVFMGSGIQLCVTVLFAIFFSAVGFLSPARRGSLMNSFLAFYVLSGSIAGYTSSRMYKAFRGRQWQYCTILTALFFPGIAFGTFVFFNIILWFLHSSASAPFLDVIIVAAMWCCVSVPLVFLGAFFGYKQAAMEFPTETSTIARAIPPPPVLLDPRLGMALTGIIPFAAAYVELFFIMTSLWMDQFYYVFGFTLIVYLILIVTCAEATVLLVYYQLCAENHRWWWFAFFASGSTAFYTFIYSIFWFRSLHASRMIMTYLLYFGYMFLISFAMWLLFGSIGALTSLWFIQKIFSTIKVD